jgi:DNA polymerase III epsilon subunit-like protein
MPRRANLLTNAMVLDVETSGTDPNEFSLISLGAVYYGSEFYVELEPDRPGWDLQSAAVHKLNRKQLEANGLNPKLAFRQFYEWMKRTGRFVSFGRYARNKIPLVYCFPYDMIWMDLYLRRYTGMNPIRNHFRDIRTMLSVLTGNAFAKIPKADLDGLKYTHNALDDAKYEMAYLEKVLSE